jgi:hypothetical protein
MCTTCALHADGHHPTYQLPPANFRLGELYEYEGATVQPLSTGWTMSEKTHRLAEVDSHNKASLATLFGEDATTAIFSCIKITEVGRKRTG